MKNQDTARSRRNRKDTSERCEAPAGAFASDAASCDARRPQQQRGQQRFNAILDATAELIAEEGIGGVRMHRICQLTRTTTGSMYHFFPDREALLRALVERHTRELHAQMERVERETTAQWAKLSTADAVERFLTPFVKYVDTHPAFLPLSRMVRIQDAASREVQLDCVVIRMTEAMVASRMPDATPAEIRSRALGVLGICEGLVHLGSRVAEDVDAHALRRELRRALIAYLEA